MENWDLIAKYIRNEATDEEKADMEQWINESEENRSAFENISKTWDTSGAKIQTWNIDKGKALAKIRKKILEEEAVTQNEGSSFKWVLRVAALLIIGMFVTWMILKPSYEKVRLSQKVNGKAVVTLPDQSVITLNSNTTLFYPEKFSENERRVKLTGEAFFEITQNPTQPFVIENAFFDVKVLGTTFNVNAYEDQPEIILTVVTGTVSLKNTRSEEILITKGETGSINRISSAIQKTSNTDANSIAWKNKKLEFNNTTFNNVCASLRSYFGYEMVVKDNRLNACRFTGTFSDPKLDEILEVLKNTLNINIQKTQKQIVISGKGC